MVLQVWMKPCVRVPPLAPGFGVVKSVCTMLPLCGKRGIEVIAREN